MIRLEQPIYELSPLLACALLVHHLDRIRGFSIVFGDLWYFLGFVGLIICRATPLTLFDLVYEDKRKLLVSLIEAIGNQRIFGFSL